MRGSTMNDHIIKHSFDQDLASGDLELEVEDKLGDPEFQIHPDTIDAEFHSVTKEKSKRIPIIASLVCGFSIVVLWVAYQVLPGLLTKTEESTPTAATASLPSSAQVPAGIASIGVPASLTGPQERKADETGVKDQAAVGTVQVVTPNGAVVVTQPAAAPDVQLSNAAKETSPAQQPAAAVSVATQPAPVLPLPAKAAQSTDAVLAAVEKKEPISASPKTAVVTVTPLVKTTSQVQIEPTSVRKPSAQQATEPPQATKAAKVQSKPVEPKMVAKADPVKKSVEMDGDPVMSGSETVKPLVTFSSGQIGLRSFSADTLVMVSSKTNSPVRYRVGDVLPSGDRIEHLDSNSMTVVTNHKVIRIVN